MRDEVEAAIGEVLAGKPRARELAEMGAALEVRRQTFLRERDTAADEARRKEWAARVREVDRQVEILRQEMAITEFVENSVRGAANRPRQDADLDAMDS